jgi:hypothetical protein
MTDFQITRTTANVASSVWRSLQKSSIEWKSELTRSALHYHFVVHHFLSRLYAFVGSALQKSTWAGDFPVKIFFG